LNASLLQNDPESVDDGGYPKQKAQNKVQYRALRRICFQINGKRGQQNREDDQEQCIPVAGLRAGRSGGKMISSENQSRFGSLPAAALDLEFLATQSRCNLKKCVCPTVKVGGEKMISRKYW
jgi:hypothetical protein